jgi:hypothetical protein
MKNILLLSLLIFSAPSFAQLYKCQVDGKTVYQDHLCQGALEIDTTNIDNESKIIARRKESEQYQLMIHPKRLRLGMSFVEVKKAWGNPSQVNRHVFPSSVDEQWVYSFDSMKTRYAHFTNGRLTSYSE